MFNKKNVLVTLISLSSLVSMPVWAHAGHEHPPGDDDHSTQASYFQELKEQKGSKYGIMLGEEHIGHFVIKAIKGNKKKVNLKIEQTFHLEEDLTKMVYASVTDDEILTYSFSTGEENYLMVIDFQNLDSGDNSAVRVVYDVEANGRTMSSEDVVVSKIVEEE